MPKLHVKKGDEVVVISGAHKGRRGRVIEVQPAKQRVLVEGVRMLKKTIKKGRSQLHPQGTIIEREGPIHISNVMRADRYDARRAAQAPAAAES
ncbi:50S ribosomal protein L24 [Fontisphaera persica]|uniref:50S ribosomal protein L24 n=1 Tax=Fontisphaera persica TaxID=2974023 RepID=UPI0024C0338E|nr:50S ribosomal protein L24 [Fontisphaera persica]WCJ59573.1 50S ribosomal protein L24 [Fontisphaera persica]